MSEQHEAAVVGRVKWFDPTKGFGFMVSEQLEGDILVHHSVLRDCVNRRTVPDGATLEVVVERGDRGLQARRVLAIDCGTAIPCRPRAANPGARDMADAGPWEPVEVKWFSHDRGYGFLLRDDGTELFVHAVTARSCHLNLFKGDLVEARAVHGEKGLTAVALRPGSTH